MPTRLKDLRLKAAAKHAARDESLAAGESAKQARAKGRIEGRKVKEMSEGLKADNREWRREKVRDAAAGLHNRKAKKKEKRSEPGNMPARRQRIEENRRK